MFFVFLNIFRGSCWGKWWPACSDPQVNRITTGAQGTANGLVLASGQEVEARLVLSNATPEVTFNRFLTCKRV
jgi:hypothetical protein